MFKLSDHLEKADQSMATVCTHNLTKVNLEKARVSLRVKIVTKLHVNTGFRVGKIDHYSPLRKPAQ